MLQSHDSDALAGGMAEWFKAVVLKTTVSLRGTVGSNPTPSVFRAALSKRWRGARVDDWGRLLSGYPGNTGSQVRILSSPHDWS